MQTKITQISTDDGRVLQIAESGKPNGFPVVMHSGTPGSHVFFAPIVKDAQAHDLRLISYNRPGYGESTTLPNRSVASVANDVVIIAKHMDVTRLATVGASGGGPHALACAALLPDLVVAAVAMESPAPYGANGLNWFANMDEGTTAEFRAAAEGREALTAFVTAAASGIASTTLDAMIEGFRSMSLSEDNVAIMEATARWFFDASREGLKHGNDGWIDDDLAFCAPWEFDLAQIQVPVLVMHGDQDTMVPIAHGRWLARQIPGADARYFHDDDHFTLFGRQFPVARAWIMNHLR